MNEGRWEAVSVDYPCKTCKHLKLFSYPVCCAAYPDGVPQEILTGKEKHKKPYRGDNGIQYEKREDDA
jgi:hypothetical protein